MIVQLAAAIGFRQHQSRCGRIGERERLLLLAVHHRAALGRGERGAVLRSGAPLRATLQRESRGGGKQAERRERIRNIFIVVSMSQCPEAHLIDRGVRQVIPAAKRQCRPCLARTKLAENRHV